MKERLDIQYTLLTDATEDCTGLWVAVLEYMDSIEDEDEDEYEQRYKANIPLARKLLQEFISKGLVVIERCKQWIEDKNEPLVYSASYTPVLPEEVTFLLSVQSHWYFPEKDSNEWICFYRTDKGLQVWREGKAALERVPKQQPLEVQS